MFKLIGSGMIVLCTTFLCSQKIIMLYYTNNILVKTMAIVKKISFERSNNLIYEKVFSRIGFEKEKFIDDMEKNSYISKEVKDKINDFFKELGKKNKGTEDEYIEYFLATLDCDKKEYSEQYLQNKKLYILYGFSLGLFLVIILI